MKRSMPEVFGLSVPKRHGRKVNFRTQFFMVVGNEISERMVVRNTKAVSEAKAIETVTRSFSHSDTHDQFWTLNESA